MKTSRLTWSIIGLFFLVSVTGVSLTLAAADFPTKYITVVCGYTAGGSTDVQMRGIVPYVQKYLGKGIIVENRPGANGIIAFNDVFSATPDGYTLLVTSIPAQTLIEKYLPENAKSQMKSYSHISAFVKDELILLGHTEMYKSIEEFIQTAKQKKLKVGISSKGNPTHLATVMLERSAKIETNIIPFEGGGESMASLSGKHIDAAMTLASAAISLTRSGVLRPLLIMGVSRHPGFPNTPSAKELGYDISIPYMTGVVAPPNVPADRVKILEAAFAKAVQEPDYVKWTKNMNIEIFPLSSADFLKETLRGYPMVEEFVKVLRQK